MPLCGDTSGVPAGAAVCGLRWASVPRRRKPFLIATSRAGVSNRIENGWWSPRPAVTDHPVARGIGRQLIAALTGVMESVASRTCKQIFVPKVLAVPRLMPTELWICKAAHVHSPDGQLDARARPGARTGTYPARHWQWWPSSRPQQLFKATPWDKDAAAKANRWDLTTPSCLVG